MRRRSICIRSLLVRWDSSDISTVAAASLCWVRKSKAMSCRGSADGCEDGRLCCEVPLPSRLGVPLILAICSPLVVGIILLLISPRIMIVAPVYIFTYIRKEENPS